MYFYRLNSTPNTFHTIGHVYPVQMNIYRRLKIPLPVKSQKACFFFQCFLLLVSGDSSNGPVIVFT